MAGVCKTVRLKKLIIKCIKERRDFGHAVFDYTANNNWIEKLTSLAADGILKKENPGVP